MYPFQSSGLSAWIGQQLLVFESLPNWLIVVLVAALVAGLTEFTSNTATSSLLLPVIAQLVRTNSMLLSIVWEFTRVHPVQSDAILADFHAGKIIYDRFRGNHFKNGISPFNTTYLYN